MDEVRSRVIAACSISPFDIDSRRHILTDAKRTFIECDFVNNESCDRRIGVGNGRARVSRHDLTCIPDLPTRFGIERRSIENYTTLLTCFETLDLTLAIEYRSYSCVLDMSRLVAEKFIVADF